MIRARTAAVAVAGKAIAARRRAKIYPGKLIASGMK